MEEYIYDETKYIKRTDLKEFNDLMLSCDFTPEEIEDENRYEMVLNYLMNFTEKAPNFLLPYEFSISMLEAYEEDEEVKSLKAGLNKELIDACNRIASTEQIFEKKIDWVIQENRPLIRGFYYHAIDLWIEGKFDVAIDIMSKLYKSNPEDSVGARYAIKALKEKMTYDTFGERFTFRDKDGVFYKTTELNEWFENV